MSVSSEMFRNRGVLGLIVLVALVAMLMASTVGTATMPAKQITTAQMETITGGDGYSALFAICAVALLVVAVTCVVVAPVSAPLVYAAVSTSSALGAADVVVTGAAAAFWCYNNECF